jgi:hypothetical protein
MSMYAGLDFGSDGDLMPNAFFSNYCSGPLKYEVFRTGPLGEAA